MCFSTCRIRVIPKLKQSVLVLGLLNHQVWGARVCAPCRALEPLLAVVERPQHSLELGSDDPSLPVPVTRNLGTEFQGPLLGLAGARMKGPKARVPPGAWAPSKRCGSLADCPGPGVAPVLLSSFSVTKIIEHVYLVSFNALRKC